jgi:hypothetical protein
LPWNSREPNLFREFVHSHTDHAFLFSNVLGQLALLSDKSQCRETKTESQQQWTTEKTSAFFLETLERKEWASYHDIFSGAICPKPRFTRQRDRIDYVSSEKLAAEFYENAAEITDHETLWLSRNQPTQFGVWQLRPNQFHIVGFVRNLISDM